MNIINIVLTKGMLTAENFYNTHRQNMKRDAANNNKNNNRRYSSLYKNTFSCNYSDSIRGRQYATYVNWDLDKKKFCTTKNLCNAPSQYL
jgi:hypothetical protein